jgi:hypothetical protein
MKYRKKPVVIEPVIDYQSNIYLKEGLQSAT